MKRALPGNILARPKSPLLQDPIEASWQRFESRPHPDKNPPDAIHEFVKWEHWLATLETAKGYFSYEYLYPLSLSLWLKAIEKKGAIQ